YPLAHEELRWFDHHLKGIDNGVAEDPPVNIFVMGINEWRTAPAWPLPGTQLIPWYLDSGGRANSLYGDGRLLTEPPEHGTPDCFTYDPERPVPSLGGNHSMQTWEQPELMEPGEIYALSIDLQVTSNVFRRGHRVGVDISSSNFPRFDRNLNTGLNNNTSAELRVAQQTIFHDAQHPSCIVLPIA